jgi:hypothetical protein
MIPISRTIRLLSEWNITLSNAKAKKNKKTGALIPFTKKFVRASLNHRRGKKTALPIDHPWQLSDRMAYFELRQNKILQTGKGGQTNMI